MAKSYGSNSPTGTTHSLRSFGRSNRQAEQILTTAVGKTKGHEKSCPFVLAPTAGKRRVKQLSIVLPKVFSTKQGVNRAECTEVIIYDYATGVGDLVSRTRAFFESFTGEMPGCYGGKLEGSNTLRALPRSTRVEVGS